MLRLGSGELVQLEWFWICYCLQNQLLTREKLGIWSSAIKKSQINCNEIYEYCHTEITIFQLFTVLDELMGDGDYLTDNFPDADLDPRHNLSKDILDYELMGDGD